MYLSFPHWLTCEPEMTGAVTGLFMVTLPISAVGQILSLIVLFFITFTRPDLTWPALTCADLTCPDLTCPDLTCPDLTCPDLTCPDLSWPALTCHVLPWPDMSCPDLTCPDLWLPAELKQQLSEQVRSLDSRADTQAALLLELQVGRAPLSRRSYTLSGFSDSVTSWGVLQRSDAQSPDAYS